MAVQECRERGTTATVACGRAARELGLKPREFQLAVQLGHVRTVSVVGGRPRVAREEIERVRSGTGFPEALRNSLWAVGTAEAAQLMGVSPARFARLARAGCFAPVRFYVNRYRAVVWHYLAADLVEFADANPGLLTGRTDPGLRLELEGREDQRARSWRARRLDQLSGRTADPWERAAVVAAVLAPDQLADAVPDAYERAYVSSLRPDIAGFRSDSAAAREVIATVTLAVDADEIGRHRERLALALDAARAARSAPRPAGHVAWAVVEPEGEREPEPERGQGPEPEQALKRVQEQGPEGEPAEGQAAGAPTAAPTAPAGLRGWLRRLRRIM
ncbi:DUF6397 family protein [Streptomyces hiroshimensis]|uniref:DNA-binding protein n=1 Tax=Streptomyces hiroshimensis TaxID=66424 RepID=A0ABQ2Y597_9ACTN|nr:DUF6397 family protein [Streptomyces hiroshimensis]GGX66339.1 hypothetical protein GCM10010324_09320 [Streptomyces hiroshimensis]